MIRVAFTLIGGRQWTGGHNYLLNLLHVLGAHAPTRIRPVLFLGKDLPETDLAPFTSIAGIEIVRQAGFDAVNQKRRLAQSLLLGCDRTATRHFKEQQIHVTFESAQFFGWRFPLAAVSWIPDFQHRHLRHLFGHGAYWKREIGFRAQVLSGRPIMLSSEDARHDCERFYPSTRGRTHVVRFAVPSQAVDFAAARRVANDYGLPPNFFFLPNQFWKHKNHECVIRALHLLKQEGISPVVAVSGRQEDGRDPEHFPRLMRMVNEWKLEQEFRVLGLIPYEHLSALMTSSMALLNPSLFEGWSTTVEEAKSLGVPMVLSDIGVHREQVSAGAQFFDPHSPRSLADALAACTRQSTTDRQALAMAAAREAETRAMKFAADFATLCELSADMGQGGVIAS